MVWNRWRNEEDQESIQKISKLEGTIHDLKSMIKGLHEELSHYQNRVDTMYTSFQNFEEKELTRDKQLFELKEELLSAYETDGKTNRQMNELEKELNVLKAENNAYKEQLETMKQRMQQLNDKEFEVPSKTAQDHTINGKRKSLSLNPSQSNVNHIQRINKQILSSRKKEKVYNDQPFLPPGSVRMNEPKRKERHHYPEGQSQVSVFNPLKYSK